MGQPMTEKFYFPVEHGVACLTALRKHTNTRRAGGDQRSRDQIMADTLVERLTGQTGATDVNIELQLIMPIDSLLNPHDPTPAEIAGHGPVPAGIARDLLRTTRGRVWWRRLFTAPPAGRWWVGIGSAAVSTAGWPADQPAGPHLPRFLL